MAQNDMNIANQGFPAFRADLNDQLEALVTNSSGATAPATTFPHQWWLDTSTTPSTLRQRNAANDAWIVVGLLNQSTNTFNVPVAQGGTGAADAGGARTNLGALAATDPSYTGTLTGGTGVINIGSGQLYKDASGNVGIGTSSPAVRLHVDGTGTQYIRVSSSTHSNFAQTFASDGSTGVEYKSVYRLVDTDAGERMRIDSSGQLHLGNTTPTDGHTSSSQFFFGLTGNLFAQRTTGLGIGGTYLLENQYVKQSTGSFAYTTSAPASRITLFQNQIIFSNAASGTAGDPVSDTERMRIDSSGYLKLAGNDSLNRHEIWQVTANAYAATIGSQNATAANCYGLQLFYNSAAPNNTSNEFLACRDNTTVRAELRSNGGIANFSGNNVNLSDRREKTNFAPAGEYLSKICAIPVQTFNYIDQNHEEDPGLTLGVVAQDVQEVAPELVMESNWGTKEEPKMRLSVYQTDLQYALMKCIQEQQAIIESLKARLDAANL